MKLLLFGTGFIASSIIRHLSSECKLEGVCFVVVYNHHKIKQKDVTQYHISTPVSEIINKELPDYIIILQGNSFVPDNKTIVKSVENNVLRTAQFLETLYEQELYLDVKKILIIGSAGEYGRFYDGLISEEMELHPTSLYGLSKIFLYNTAKYYCDRGLKIVYARQFNTVGPGQRDTFVFQSFINQMLQHKMPGGRKEVIVGDLTQERDFIDIRDTVRAYYLLLEKGEIGEVYNIGSGESIVINDLLKKIIRASGLKIENLVINSSNKLVMNGEKLSKRLCADISKLKSLGFVKRYSVDDSIDYILKSAEKNYA